MLGRWVDPRNNQVSDGPSIILTYSTQNSLFLFL